MGHPNGGDLHPTCKKCVKAWALISDICGTCKQPLDTSSLFTLQEKAIIELKTTIKDVFNGVLAAILVIAIKTLLPFLIRKEKEEENFLGDYSSMGLLFMLTGSMVAFGLVARHKMLDKF